MFILLHIQINLCCMQTCVHLVFVCFAAECKELGCDTDFAASSDAGDGKKPGPLLFPVR